MKKSIIKSSVVLMLIALGIYSCQSQNGNKGGKEQANETAAKQNAGIKTGEVDLSQKQFDAMGIQLGNVEQRNLSDIVKTNGFIILPPQLKADVSTFMGGVVKSVNVIAGDQVKKGQVLAMLESPDYIQLQEDYLKAKSNLSFLEKDYARQKEMLSANATSQKMYQQTTDNYNSTKATVLSLQNKLKLLGISINDLENGQMVSAIPVLSPLNGYVQKVNINVGKFVDPALQMFEIINNSELLIDLQVYQQDIGKVKPGQKVYFSLPDQNSAQSEATVFAIDRGFDNATKAITVHAKVLRNGRTDLFPGIYVQAYIEVGNKRANAVPSDAIYKDGETENVFLLSQIKIEGGSKNYIFLPVEVKAGVSDEGYTAVSFLDSIPPNAKLVTKGTYYIVSEKNKGESIEQD